MSVDLTRFCPFAQQPRYPDMPPDELQSRARDALVPLRPTDGRLAWQGHAPWFYPAEDNSGKWDFMLGLLWEQKGRGEDALRAALGTAAGKPLSPTDLNDFRFYPRPSDIFQELGITYHPELFLYTGHDVESATTINDRAFVIVDYNNNAWPARYLHLGTDVSEKHAIREERPASPWDALIGYELLNYPQQRYWTPLTKLHAIAMLTESEKAKFSVKWD